MRESLKDQIRVSADFYVDEELLGKGIDEQQCWDGFMAGAIWMYAFLEKRGQLTIGSQPTQEKK